MGLESDDEHMVGAAKLVATQPHQVQTIPGVPHSIWLHRHPQTHGRFRLRRGRLSAYEFRPVNVLGVFQDMGAEVFLPIYSDFIWPDGSTN